MPNFDVNTPAQIGDIRNGFALPGGGYSIGLKRPYIHNGMAVANVGTPDKPQIVRVNNATLRKDAWKAMDEAILKVARERLRAADDINAAGLVHNVNGMSQTQLDYEEGTDLGPAELTMDAINRTNNDRPEFTLRSLPLPIIHKDFQLNKRALDASRNSGSPLDTYNVEQCTRRVAEKLEDLVLIGSSTYTFAGNALYGYTDFPQRQTGSLSGDWDTLTEDSTGTVGERIKNDVLGMIQLNVNANFFGPYILYIPKAYQETMQKDYNQYKDKTIKQKLMDIDGLSDVRVADRLTADTVVLVQMSSDVVRMVKGLPFTVIQWGEEGGLALNYKVMTLQVPQLRRSPGTSVSGVVVYT